jgi:hypothetical protein
MHLLKWQREDESVIESPKLDDLRPAFFERPAECYRMRSSLFSTRPLAARQLLAPLQKRGGSMSGTHCLPIFKTPARSARSIVESTTPPRRALCSELSRIPPMAASLDNIPRAVVLTRVSQRHLRCATNRLGCPALHRSASRSASQDHCTYQTLLPSRSYGRGWRKSGEDLCA